MWDILLFLLGLIFCLGVPAGLLIALIAWLTRREREQPRPELLLAAFREQIRAWVAAGRLSDEAAAPLLALIAEDLAGRHPAAATASAPVAPPSYGATSASAGMPAATPAAVPVVPTAPAAVGSVAGGQKPAPPLGEQMGAALMALRTRRALLFLGAFLLVVSALVLVVFSWASFSPFMQFGLIVAVCAGLWGGGAWVARQEGLERAGRNLQAVGGLLVPVCGFALSRPGLLDLDPRGAWLVASVVSLPLYLGAAWRLRSRFFAVSASLAAVSALLAGLRFAGNEWLPAAAALLLAGYPLLAQALRRRGAPDLAAGPFWVAQIGLPISLFSALALLAGWSADYALATGITFAAATLGYGLTTWVERRPGYLWVAALLLPIAAGLLLDAFDAGFTMQLLTMALLALGYLIGGATVEPKAQQYALPGYLGAALLGLPALLLSLLGGESARMALPVLILTGTATVALRHHGRFAWLNEQGRDGISVMGLLTTAFGLPLWWLAMLELTALTFSERVLYVLPISALVFAAAYWWPGKLRPAYSSNLQIAGIAIAVLPALIAWSNPDLQLATALLLTGVWAFQTVLRRHWSWAALALGSLLLAAVRGLFELALPLEHNAWLALFFAFTLLYALGGTLLRKGPWRCLTGPGLGWALLTGWATLSQIAVASAALADLNALQVAAVAGLAALAAGLGAIWRKPWAGYPAALLAAGAVLMAATLGFFTPWRPAFEEYGLILAGITLALVLVREGVWRYAPGYAAPYALVGYALLTLAPLPAFGSIQAGCLTWSAMALLYGWAAWRYRLPLVVIPAFLAMDLALLSGAAWRFPNGDPTGAARLLMVAAWVQGLFGLWAGRREAALGTLPRWKYAPPAYAAMLLTGLGALAFTTGNTATLLSVAAGLAVLAALLATVERSEPAAWLTLLLTGLSLEALHELVGLEQSWPLAWGVAEALVISLAGWGLERLGPLAAVWRRPLSMGPLVAGALLTLATGAAVVAGESFPPLTFALATLGLLLTTQAVRQREILYGYAAGAALVGAGLCQLGEWGFSSPQWYVVPAGLYLLALAEGLRRFQGQHRVAQLIDAGALLLMLGTTLGQSLRAEGLALFLYALVLCAESLLLLGYGTLRKLRVPFFGGIGFFVAGVLWMVLDPLRSTNQWALLGGLGLLLVAAYVLLERRQEQLQRAGRVFMEELRGWQ